MWRAWLVLMLSLSGCETLSSFFAGDAAEPSYASDAETNLQRGQKALDRKNFVEAQKYFDYVKSKYPYLEAATAAELMLGDTEFAREKYLEARDRYQTFVKLHPTHPKVDYAAFRSAMTHYKDIPSDLFVFPPSIEKDQNEVRAAQVALNDFIKSYATSQYVPEAQKTLNDVRRRLAEHELYVASFYRRRDRWMAVVTRLGNVARDFGDLGFEDEVYFGMYDAYLKLNDPEKAKAALRTLVARYPDTKAAKRAARVLGNEAAAPKEAEPAPAAAPSAG